MHVSALLGSLATWRTSADPMLDFHWFNITAMLLALSGMANQSEGRKSVLYWVAVSLEVVLHRFAKFH